MTSLIAIHNIHINEIEIEKTIHDENLKKAAIKTPIIITKHSVPKIDYYNNFRYKLLKQENINIANERDHCKFKIRMLNNSRNALIQELQEKQDRIQKLEKLVSFLDDDNKKSIAESLICFEKFRNENNRLRQIIIDSKIKHPVESNSSLINIAQKAQEQCKELIVCNDKLQHQYNTLVENNTSLSLFQNSVLKQYEYVVEYNKLLQSQYLELMNCSLVISNNLSEKEN